MKILAWIVLAHALLVGAALVLLNSDQAPPPEPEKPVEVAAPAQPVAEKKPVMSTEAFRTMAAEVMSTMPKADSPGKEPSVFAAGQRVALILEKTEGDAGLQEEARTLLRSCALSVQHSDAVKAVCYMNFRALSRSLGKSYPDRMVGKHIRDLADQLEK